RLAACWSRRASTTTSASATSTSAADTTVDDVSTASTGRELPATVEQVSWAELSAELDARPAFTHTGQGDTSGLVAVTGRARDPDLEPVGRKPLGESLAPLDHRDSRVQVGVQIQ